MKTRKQKLTNETLVILKLLVLQTDSRNEKVLCPLSETFQRFAPLLPAHPHTTMSIHDTTTPHDDREKIIKHKTYLPV